MLSVAQNVPCDQQGIFLYVFTNEVQSTNSDLHSWGRGDVHLKLVMIQENL